MNYHITFVVINAVLREEFIKQYVFQNVDVQEEVMQVKEVNAVRVVDLDEDHYNLKNVNEQIVVQKEDAQVAKDLEIPRQEKYARVIYAN